MVVPIIPDDGARSKMPSAPELSPTHHVPDHIRQEEEGIHFKVGPNEDDVFVKGVILTVGFLALFIRRRNNLMTNGTFTLKHVEKEGFEMMIRHLEGEKIKFRSTTAALLAMRTAYYCECTSLCKLAVNYCDLNLNPANLLEVMKTVIPLNKLMIDSVKWDSSFFLDAGVEDRLEIKSLLYALQCNCAIVSGICADELLLNEEFLELDMETGISIIQSMDLLISNELILFNVFLHWCNKYMANESPAKQREKIGDHVLFLVRYGVMSEEEFTQGPAKSKLLLPHEVDTILKYLRNNRAVRFEGKMRNLDKKRVRDNVQPFDLSLRTLGGCSHLCPDREKCKNVQPNIKPKKEKEPPKLLLGMLRCWQVVFD